MKSIISIVFLSLSGLGFSSNSDEQVVPTQKDARALTATSDETSPQIVNISAVATDVLCIEIDACRLLPIVQLPYHADSADVIKIGSRTPLKEVRSMSVSRNGSPFGWLTGKDRKTLMRFERLVGEHLNTADADASQNYLISSPSDPSYTTAIHPKNVWRKSKPSNWVIDGNEFGPLYTAKHFIYLKLPSSLKSGQTYLIKMPGLNLKSPSAYYVHDPVSVRSEAVHVSQIGFRADDPYKTAYLSVWMGNGGGYTYPDNLNFSLLDDKTNEKVFSGKAVMQWKGSVPEEIGTHVNHSATDVLRLDFSSFKTPGRYRVYVEGIGSGYPFNIDEVNTWKHAFEISMKGHYNHRSGIEMGPPYTSFVRPRSFHPADGVKVYQSTCSLLNSGNGLNALGTDKGNFKNLCEGLTDKLVENAWGGTMDAGDFDRRIQHLSGTRLYLELMELYPDYFNNLSLNIPESKNDLPDLVDESLYGLDVYRRLQMPDGGIRGGIESSEHPSGDVSWQDQFTNMVYAPDHWSSYIYAGVAARAAVILKKLGKIERAKVWERSAVKAMEWAEVEYDRWKASPDFAKIREQVKKRIPIERNLAAVELYRLTQNKRWHEVYLSTKNNQSNRTDAAFVYARLDKSLVNKKEQQAAINLVMTEANARVNISAKSTYGITNASPGKPLGGWESSYSVPESEALVRAHYLTGDQQYLKVMIRSTLYAAGANPMNLCLTTGLGQNPVLHPLHVDTRYIGQPAPVGITVCGPAEVPEFAPIESAFGKRLNTECTPAGSKWPSAESYFDVHRWAAMNEYVVDGNIAPSGYIWGYLASRKAK